MFTIEVRKVKDNTVSKWVKIWESEDGADTAKYLKECVQVESTRTNKEVASEYRMLWVAK